ncbi:hypothetical protein PCCS19_15480 [Paenibacillus sp. CCS19]|uniref:hypothetical protein n=1 Tax=Paenibacillus sp. CCS19 TaxID=3158387 RepID=UPI00256A4756|nr:hypothetical protein [Paenibacillus cellulosilyticus]GMK38494.1 hypothetical protein PCCS19_15480 [Paenibacillus cellulosilyticus]
MNKTTVLLRASLLQLRLYLWIILGVIAVSVITDLIISLAMGPGNNSSVSASNLFNVLLIFVGSVLPASFFKRVINIGATRKEYYVGVLLVYAISAAFLALLNIAWLQLEMNVIRNYEHTFNILVIFHWDQFGIVGMFGYQFGAYLLLLALLNLLFSGLRHAAGWAIWAVFVATIPLFTAIASLRSKLADGLQALLFNPSLLQGFGLTFGVACLLFAGGWWFTARRSYM